MTAINSVLPIWWLTEVIVLFVRYWAVVLAARNFDEHLEKSSAASTLIGLMLRAYEFQISPSS